MEKGHIERTTSISAHRDTAILIRERANRLGITKVSLLDRLARLPVSDAILLGLEQPSIAAKEVLNEPA